MKTNRTILGQLAIKILPLPNKLKNKIIMSPATKKFVSIASIIVVVALAVFIYVRYFYVFGEGVKAGDLNYVVYKGVVFKTYEGKLIQSGFRGKQTGVVQSYEFEFSVADKELAEKLMLKGGESVELHYKEYFAPLPWRGYSKFVVDGIVNEK